MKNKQLSKLPCEAREMIVEIKRLTTMNARITKSGRWFTPVQIENERKSWILKMRLRTDHNLELGTY